MMDPFDELDRVPPEVRARALRAALIAWDNALEGYGLDVLARLDLLEQCLQDSYDRLTAEIPPEPAN